MDFLENSDFYGNCTGARPPPLFSKHLPKLSTEKCGKSLFFSNSTNSSIGHIAKKSFNKKQSSWKSVSPSAPVDSANRSWVPLQAPPHLPQAQGLSSLEGLGICQRLNDQRPHHPSPTPTSRPNAWLMKQLHGK